MKIAILFDAKAVAGHSGLLSAAKQDLIDAMRGERVHRSATWATACARSR